MSIINDAIKKARKEFEWKNKVVARKDITKEGSLPTEEGPESKVSLESSEIKWVAIVVVSLVLIVSLLGSIFLYKHMSRLNTAYNPEDMLSAEPRLPITITSPRQKTVSLPEARLEDALELNGIVYGPEDKWAIINNKIIREGDSLLNGRLAFIAKDFVRIEKNDGEEIVLELR